MRKTALILVDVQKGFDHPCWGKRNNRKAERNMALLLKAWRGANQPVFHIQHMSTEKDSPLRPGLPGNAIKDEVRPIEGEPVIRKTVNSGFIGTDLENRLRKERIESVAVVGITTNHCVSTTARMAGNLGFKTIVVADATATFDRIGPDGKKISAQQMHRVGLAELHQEFAEIVETKELLSRLKRNE